jgi:hypothetical protein
MRFIKPSLYSQLALSLLAAGNAAHAVESGAPITPFGVYDFSAGMLPPASEIATVGFRAAFYNTSSQRGSSGDPTGNDISLKANSYALAVIKMTDYTLFGGKYGYAVVVPVLDMSNEFTIHPAPGVNIPLSGQNTAQGDVAITPVMLGWTPTPGLYTNAALQFQLPTGSYDKTRIINAGSNHWTVTPSFAFSYIMPSGFEVSSNFQLNFNTRNNATDYKSGVEYQHEFALGQHVGSWTFGLGGYHYQQITDDETPGLTTGNRSRVTAIGPVVNFFELGSGLPLVWVHAYKEFSAENRTQGTQVTVRAAWTF